MLVATQGVSKPRPGAPPHMRHLLPLVALVAAYVPAQSWVLVPTAVPATISAWDLARNRLVLVGTDSAQRWHEWDGTRIRERIGALTGSPPISFLRYDASQERFWAVTTSPASTAYSVASWSRGDWTWATGGTPPTTATAAVAYDEARRRLIVHSGNLHEWDGQRWWSLGATSAAPGGSSNPFAYDPNLQRCILYVHGSGTWAWDGFAWSLAGGTEPGVRAGATIALDRSRNRLVMFGGVGGTTDTWAWSGSGWQQLATTSNPPAVLTPQLHDDGTGVTLFDPTSREIWQLRGNAWTLADRLATAPVYRNNTAFAYDHARHVVVGFGGDQGGLTVPADQTMLYDRGWLRCAPATNPPLRHSAHLAWSDLNQQVLLFGGVYQGTIHRGDTWLWSGSDWIAQQPTQSPTPREGAVMAQDPLGGVMLFGGKDATTTFGDQWHWNGSDWSPVNVPGPSPRFRPQHAYDPSRGIVVAYGGFGPNQAYLPETWTWNGTAWTQHTTALVPLNMRTAAFRPATGRVVVADAGNAFEWDGSEWLTAPGIGSGATPPLFARFATHFDDGELLNISVPAVKRWISFAAAVDAYGSPCALGTNPTLTALDRPRFDTDMQLEVSAAVGAVPHFLVLGLAAQSVDLGAGCRSLVALDVGTLFALSSSSGISRFDLQTPNVPGLLGMQFTAQGAVFAPSSSPLGSAALTAALRMLVGQ